MDIKLHLGAHRCASSTFQHYLWVNRATLGQRGITCWTPKRTRDGLMRGLVRNPERITLQDERVAVRSVGRLRLEFNRLRRLGQAALLISEENIMGTGRENLCHTSLYPLLFERLLRFGPVFDGARLQIGLCIRSYENYWASTLAYQLPRGGKRPDMDTLDRLTTQPRRWRDLVREIVQVFPEADVIVYPFERFAQRPDAALDAFCDGASSHLPRVIERHNCSLTVGALNNILTTRGEHRIDAGPAAENSRWMPFNEDQRAVLRAEYRRDITWLQNGAEDLARYVDGRQTPATACDRARMQTDATPSKGAFTKGHSDGIEERMGRTRTG